MHLTFRTKLALVVGAAAVAFVVLIIVGTLSERRIERQLAVIQERYVPKVELGPQLENQFEHLRRNLQDAVATQDPEILGSTRQSLDQFLQQLASAHQAVAPQEAAALRTAVQDYYASAYDVARRLIAGEKGEAIVDAMASMQTKHSQTAARLQKATSLDRGAMTAAFLDASRAQSTSAQIRLGVSLLCLVLVVLLAFWLGRDVVRSLSYLAAGVQRFGQGDFTQPIPVTSHDELGAVAEQTNHMAASLHRLNSERDRHDWLRAGEAGLAHELRGDLEPQEVANRATRFLARYIEAPAAALYLAEPARALVLTGDYALPRSGPAGAKASFAPGEGLVGQAAQGDELVVVQDPPADYLKVGSGLGESAPRAIVLLPLARVGTVTGVLELAVFRPWTALQGELLMGVRETLTIALEVARARAALRELLAETQRQAQRLATQEEELRSTNEELQAQQEELTHTNEQVIERAKELEEQRRVLEEKNAELQDTRRRLEQKAVELTTISTYKSQFLANMSHELRTPLNSMLLLSNLMAQNESGNLTEKQVEFSKTINAAGKDLLALINQVLDLAKIEAGKQQVRIEAVTLRQSVQHLERVFSPLARDKGLKLVVDLAPDLPDTIATDKQRLDQILNNLLGNAIKFTDRGQVSLRVSRPDPHQRLPRGDLDRTRTVLFAVTDTGIGVAPEFHKRIFEPFEQVESKSDRRFGGTGLGLPIARELAALLGGALELQSTPGSGSTFLCFLPETSREQAQVSPAAALPAAPAAQRADDRAVLEPGDRCVLVIEDDPLFADHFSEVIHEQGLKCLIATDGESGLRMARERQPSGIVLDVRLPDVDGWNVMDRLRADPATASIPVHFISAGDGGERGMAMGAVGYLTKPASRRDLVRVIDSLAPKGERDCRVLVVEDDSDTADSLVRRLQGERLVVQRVASAGEALAALGKSRFDCMVLDLSLPDMDGLQLLQSLQESGAPESPPVVVYTGRALSKAEAKRLETYAEAVVMKEGPSAERLLDEVRLFARRFRDGIPTRRRLAPRVHAADVDLKGRKILVVDDDMRTVYALSALLRAKGADVVAADTGHAALDLLASQPDVQIVLMDMMMPEMDGYEAVRRLRKEDRFRELPVIALTAKAMKGDREQCLQAGANEYLSKPIDADRLLSMMQTQLAARG